MSLHVVPLELAEANEFVERHHRHHKPIGFHRFSIGAVDESGALRGVAIVSKPVARALSPRDVVEVSRLCTDGTRNACSLLYAACARAAAAMGYRRIQTYTLPSEGGASLRASGWTNAGEAGGGQWVRADGAPRRTDQPTDVKYRWERELVERPDVAPPVPDPDEPTLFDTVVAPPGGRV